MTRREVGIILRAVKYTDHSRVVRMFTRDHGLKAFLVNTGKSNRDQAALLHPLGIVSFSSSFHESGRLQRAVSLERHLVFHALPFDIEKGSMAMFLDEILTRTIPDDYINKDLFEFIVSFTAALDAATDCRQYHLWFLIHLSRFYGFFPQLAASGGLYFDLREGCFAAGIPVHAQFISGEVVDHLRILSVTNLGDLASVPIPPSLRSALLETLITYYQIHLEGLREIKSHRIFQEVFDSVR